MVGISETWCALPKSKKAIREQRYYEKNKTAILARARERWKSDPSYRRRRIKALKASQLKHKREIDALLAKLKSRPCLDCKRRYPPYVMDFDHVKGRKSFQVSIARRLWVSVARILKEIAKCELVCANCHRERTHKRTRDMSKFGRAA